MINDSISNPPGLVSVLVIVEDCSSVVGGIVEAVDGLVVDSAVRSI
jgi:hypothetical protein